MRPEKEVRPRQKSDHRAEFNRQPCRYFLRGTCTISLCEYWHPPECQFYKTESGCRAGEMCLFPHCKVAEEPSNAKQKKMSLLNPHCNVAEEPSKKQKKALNPQNGKKRRQGCCG